MDGTLPMGNADPRPAAVNQALQSADWRRSVVNDRPDHPQIMQP